MATIDAERAFRLHWEDGQSWDEVRSAMGADLTARGVKSAAWRWERDHPEIARPIKEARSQEPQIVNSEGIRADEQPLIDEDEVLRRAYREWELTESLMARRKNQRLEFDHGPVALVEVADVHLGGSGINYPRAFDEAEIIAATPGMYAVFAGDVLDNFVIGKLRRARDDSHFTICEEWVLTKRYLQILKDKLVVVVSGNHDQWVKLLAGFDYFREVVASIRKDVIYDANDALIKVRVGFWELPIRVRHQWRGTSIYNPTHGIERAMKWDQGFVIGMGAHTHVSGVVRSTNVGGLNGMAMVAGTYKRCDDYARYSGFPRPNTSTAVTVVIDDEDRSLTGFDNLDTAARYMEAMYANT